MRRKSLSHVVQAILELWNIGLFAFVWFVFYNEYVFESAAITKGLLTISIYVISYNFLCHIYQSFRIASVPVGELMFSQLISFGLPDLLMYLECCLLSKVYVNIVPGAMIVMAQFIGSAWIMIGARKLFIHHVSPQKTVLIYGASLETKQLNTFCQHMRSKYQHLFNIVDVVREGDNQNLITSKIGECETVILYEVTAEQRSELLNGSLEKKRNIYLTPLIDDIVMQGCSVRHFLDTPLMKYEYIYQRQPGYSGKRFWDILISFFMIILTSPIMIFTAAAIKIEDRGPVFYRQKRCTKNARVFEIIKFRSMVVDAEKSGIIPCKEKDNRITKVGKVIRATRIDELPQLLNIIKGDMSFVGPRPERVEHVQQYMKELPEFAYRMRVKGGLTGYAQIFGKYNTSAYDKLRLDLMYIENQSFYLDLKIVLLTFRTIFQLESTEGFTDEASRSMNRSAKKNIDTDLKAETGS